MIIDNLECEPDMAWVPQRCKEIAKRCEGNQDQLEKELAIFVADDLLHTINVELEPPVPEILKKYRVLGDEMKMRFDKDRTDWRKTGEIVEYNNAVSGVRAQNISHVHGLRGWLRKDIGKERYNKILAKLKEFVGLDYYETTAVKNVVKQFHGRVGSSFARPKDILYTNYKED